MRSAVVLVVLAGCGFQTNGSPDMQKPADAATAVDAAATDHDAGMPMTDAAASTFCDSDDRDLVACFEFEDNTHDLSTNHLDAQMTRVSYDRNGKSGKALHVDDNSAGNAADSAAFDVAALTMEAWINPSKLPDSGEHFDVLDVDKQYALFVDSSGNATCILGGIASMSATAPQFHVRTGRWTHIACTFDGIAAGTAKGILYVNGDVAGTSATAGQSLLITGTTGLTIGGNNPSDGANRMTGLIDQLRLMKIARPPIAICADAGKVGCL
jgi:hypothetical protein